MARKQGEASGVAIPEEKNKCDRYSKGGVRRFIDT
jgi:hypothetical protein